MRGKTKKKGAKTMEKKIKIEIKTFSVKKGNYEVARIIRDDFGWRLKTEIKLTAQELRPVLEKLEELELERQKELEEEFKNEDAVEYGE